MIDINLNLPIDTTPTNGSTNLIDSNAVFDGLATKVDKVTGKQLSTEDYTSTEKSKLAGISAGAEVNVNADFNAVSGDAQILNKPTFATYISDTITDGEITKAPTQNAVFDALQIFKWTFDLMAVLTYDVYAPYNMKITSVTNVFNAPTTTILDDGAAYTLGATIAMGSLIKVTVSTASVISLNVTKL